jgi:hypothetical protein
MGCYHPSLQKKLLQTLRILKLSGWREMPSDPTHSKSVLAGGGAFLGMVSGKNLCITLAQHL